MSEKCGAASDRLCPQRVAPRHSGLARTAQRTCPHGAERRQTDNRRVARMGKAHGTLMRPCALKRRGSARVVIRARAAWTTPDTAGFYCTLPGRLLQRILATHFRTIELEQLYLVMRGHRVCVLFVRSGCSGSRRGRSGSRLGGAGCARGCSLGESNSSEQRCNQSGSGYCHVVSSHASEYIVCKYSLFIMQGNPAIDYR